MTIKKPDSNRIEVGIENLHKDVKRLREEIKLKVMMIEEANKSFFVSKKSEDDDDPVAV